MQQKKQIRPLDITSSESHSEGKTGYSYAIETKKVEKPQKSISQWP